MRQGGRRSRDALAATLRSFYGAGAIQQMGTPVFNVNSPYLEYERACCRR
jgi:hypothetical protein